MGNQIFTLKGEKFIVNENGELAPYIEPKIEVKQEPWQAANSIADTVKILKLSRTTVMNLISAGHLKAIKASTKRWLVPGWAIEEFLGQKK